MSRYRIIGNQKERATEWARDRFPHQPFDPYYGDTYSALINEMDGDIQAVVFYNHFDPGNSICAHVASLPGRRWLTRSFLLEVFGYPFIELGVRRITAMVASDNHRMLRFTTHLGFVPEGRFRQQFGPNIDMLVFGMLKDECRFLELQTRESEAKTSHASRSDSYYRSAVGGELRICTANSGTEPYQPGHALRSDKLYH